MSGKKRTYTRYYWDDNYRIVTDNNYLQVRYKKDKDVLITGNYNYINGGSSHHIEVRGKWNQIYGNGGNDRIYLGENAKYNYVNGGAGSDYI
ncbi:MAG: hypothetical protein IIY37_06590, partial [Selenomonadaceae bacterium]|nr:hypothetical protein [Selenomonadaceae bacterium]